MNEPETVETEEVETPEVPSQKIVAFPATVSAVSAPKDDEDVDNAAG